MNPNHKKTHTIGPQLLLNAALPGRQRGGRGNNFGCSSEVLLLVLRLVAVPRPVVLPASPYLFIPRLNALYQSTKNEQKAHILVNLL
jgi:hypothetical protein